MSFHVPENFRVTDPRAGAMATDRSDGNNGMFIVRLKLGDRLRVIASEGLGWEHVSVSRTDRTPTWAEMCQIKALFWDPEDCVMQFHPPESEYVNLHPYCLHLWRPIGTNYPVPPSIMVGPVTGSRMV